MPSPNAPELPQNRLKRLRMRAWRRGMKEMDLILGPFADSQLATLDLQALDLLESLMAENDQDIYAWITGPASAPPRFAALIARLAAFARARHGPPAA